METEDAVLVAGNAVDNLGAPEPLNLSGAGRKESLDSGPAVFSNVEYTEKTMSEEGGLDVRIVATGNIVSAGGDEKKEEVGMLVQCTSERTGAMLTVEQVPSASIRNVDQAIMITDADTESEARDSLNHIGVVGDEVAGIQQGEARIATDSLMEHVAIDTAMDASSPVNEGAILSGETQSLQVVPPAELSKGLNTKINGSVSSTLNCSSEFANGREAEESLLSSRRLALNTENRDDMMKKLENLMVIQESRTDADRYRTSSSSITEVVAAGVAAGVAEGIAESIAETIAKETAGSCGHNSMEGRLFDSSRFERMAIAKAVAEVIAESVAQEVAQGLADGLAEAAATSEAFNGVEQRKLDNIQGMAEGDRDGVLCDCGVVAVVRVVGEKSPNRGLRYLMCSRQEPSFFKRKGKRKESDTIGKCKFFRWLDTPRYTSKEDKRNQGKEKTQLEDLNTSYSTRASAKKSNVESPRGEVSPSEISGPRNTDDSLQLTEAPESTPDLRVKPARKQRKKRLSEESARDEILVADRPTSAGTLTRSALRKGAPEVVQEPSLDTSAVSTPASALGKRTIDWTDSYIGPESHVFEKGASWRKRRSVRGEHGPSSRYSIGGSGNGRNIGFGSSEKKPLHYFRRSTGQIGASGGETISLLSSPLPSADVESAGAGHKDEGDNRFKSYYKKGTVRSSLELKSKSISANTSDKLVVGKSRVIHAAEELSLVEIERKSKSQTRRQQRKLPLSEVYGAVETLRPVEVNTKGAAILVDKDHSLLSSRQSLGNSTPTGAATEHKEAGYSKSPPKKRKLSWVLSEDSVAQETDTPKRTSARKSNSGHINSGRQNLLFSMVETPLLASAFPTVRYEAKLPTEDYHDPDDPWSLEIPWTKQEHGEERAQQQESEKETSEDERDAEAGEGGDIEMKMDITERTEAVNEHSAVGEELSTKASIAAESMSVPDPAEFIGSEKSGEPESSNKCLNAAAGKDYDIPGPCIDQETVNASVDSATLLADAVDGCARQAVGAHPGLLVDGQEVSEVLKDDLVDAQHEVCTMPDGTVEVTSVSATEEELPNSNTLISGNPDSPVHSKDDMADKLKSWLTYQNQEARPDNDITLQSGEEKLVHSRLSSETVPPYTAREEHMLLHEEVEDVQRSDGFVELSPDNGSLLSAPDGCGQPEQKDQIVEELIVEDLNQGGVNNRETDVPSSQSVGNDSKVPDSHITPNEVGSAICEETHALHEQKVEILQGQLTSVLPDEQTTGDEIETSMLDAQTDTQVKAGRQESLMSENAIMKVSASVEESDRSAPDKTELTTPLEQIPSIVEIFASDSRQSVHVGGATTEDVTREDNLLLGSVAIVHKHSSSKLDNAVESSEPPGVLRDSAVTNEREPVLSGGEHRIDNLQESVKGTHGSIEEPAVSGSNLIADGCPDGRVGQMSNHETEGDLPHTSLDQDAALKSPREADHVGAAAASENAGFVNSVWRLASGKKTRSIGSIGVPAVTSKRSRSGVPSQKGGLVGERRDLRHQAEIQWVDVPLDWRNEKSTGRVPLLSNSSGKGLNGSDTTQSELRLLQSADTSHGTHSARPRLARGEVDESSIITEEKEKGHDACNEDSTDYNAPVTNRAAHARQGTLGNTAMGDEASVPASGHFLDGVPTNQQAVVAGGDNVVQKRKRGRPRKDSKKPVGLQHSVASGCKVGAAGGVNQAPEPEQAGVVGKADGEPSSMIICSTTMEGTALTESRGEDRISQLERSASNTERENGKREGGSSGSDECERPLDASDVPSATIGGLNSEIAAPYCSCKIVPRQAVLKTVVRGGDPNQGLRYWSCSNYRKLFTKKRKSPLEVTEESCNYFRWLDTPRVTAKDKREARKERYRQVEMQRLL